MNSALNDVVITARAPGKVILFGEHAINRGQPALAAAAGLYVECTVRASDQFRFRSQSHEQVATRAALEELAGDVEDYRARENFEAIRKLAGTDYFAPQKYILASAYERRLPEGLDVVWQSEIPSSSGLGSGGSAFTSLVAAITPLLPDPPSLEQRASWAHRGDIIAHGGIASALDTQTSLLGGVICYTGKGLATQAPCAPGLSLIIGHTCISAATSEVNSRVRRWLADKPEVRISYFQTIGALTRAALPALEEGNWTELGRLLNLNQLVLEKIGVSCPESDRLIEAALGAGAYGAKISGSGGGGIVIALVGPEQQAKVAAALSAAGGKVYVPRVAVEGVQVGASGKSS